MGLSPYCKVDAYLIFHAEESPRHRQVQVSSNPCIISYYRRLRRTLPPKILIHLCFSLMLTLICFVAGADRTESLYVCRAFAISIHYFMLTTFLWMTVEAFNLYISFVVVMGSYISRFMLKAALYAWGK